MSADPLVTAVIVLLVASLMALALLLAAQRPATACYGAVYILTAPIRALGRTITGAVRTALASVNRLGNARAHPILRGAVIAVPLALVFALLFATADPIFARARDAAAEVLTSWTFVPRLIFGTLLTLFMLGAYSVVAWGDTRTPSLRDERLALTLRNFGVTERVIVLAVTAAVFWVFVLLQLSYLFTNSPELAGSGVTFAEYARRGFGELAVAATIAAFLIVATRSFATNEAPPTEALFSLRAAALTLLAAVVCVLVSALRRVSLYEDAYGFTTSRVYAQAYMAMTLVILAFVVYHVIRRFDTAQLARQIMTVALATFAILVYWNEDAWIATRNLDRFADTGKIDVAYLTRGLAVDAYPTLANAIPTLPPTEASALRDALVDQASRKLLRTDRWFEWNVRRERAREAMAVLGGRLP